KCKFIQIKNHSTASVEIKASFRWFIISRHVGSNLFIIHDYACTLYQREYNIVYLVARRTGSGNHPEILNSERRAFILFTICCSRAHSKFGPVRIKYQAGQLFKFKIVLFEFEKNMLV